MNAARERKPARLSRLWRRTLRPIWRTVRPWALLTLAAGTLVLGTIGWGEYKSNYGFLDSLLHALTLFGFNVALEPKVPAALNVARLMGPLVTGYAALQGVMAVFRDQLQHVFIWARMRRHVVVVGLGATGFRLAKAFHDPDLPNGGFPTVAIESNPDNPSIAGCRDRGISVLKGDWSDPVVLGKAMLNRADYMFVASGDDRRDLDVSAAAAALSERRRSGCLTAFVSLDDVDLWRRLSAATLAAPDRNPRFRRELFHIPDLAGRIMLDQYPPFSPEAFAREGARVLIVGVEGVGESLVIHLVRTWQKASTPGGRRLTVIFAGASAQADRALLLKRYPELKEICELAANDMALEASEYREEGWLDDGGPQLSAAYVCYAEESEAAKAALALATRPAMRDVPIIVTVEDADAGVGTVLRKKGPDNVHAFGVLSSALTPAMRRGGTHEILAREMHEGYVRYEQSTGKTKQDNAKLVPWEELSTEDKEANLAFVDGIGEKLDMIDCTLAPAPLIDPKGPLDELTDLETLAKDEHRRWCDQKQAAGWTHDPDHPGRRDEKLKIHPYLVDWNALDETVKDIDREAVRTIPQKLAGAGFCIVPLGAAKRDAESGRPTAPTRARAGVTGLS